jgi:hypothetical protein
MKRLHVCLILTLALLLITVSVTSAKRNANPGVLPPNSRVQGMTYGEWSAVWFQRAFGIPASENPLLTPDASETCFFDRVGNVGLGIAGFAPFETSCSVPAGTKLFMLIVATECSTLEPPPFHGENEEQLRTCAIATLPSPELEATIDGVALENLSDYLVTSPLYQLTLPEDNILGLPAGTGQSVAHGAWLMLAPLSVGQHTIYLHGTIPDFDYEATYHITVTPRH